MKESSEKATYNTTFWKRQKNYGDRMLPGVGGCVCVCVCVCVLSPVRLFVAPWIVAPQAPLSVEFPRQESWSRLPFPTRRDLADSGVNPSSLTFCVGRWVLFHQRPQEGWVGRTHRGF